MNRRSQEIRLADTKHDRPRLLALPGDLAKLIARRWRRRAVGDRIARWVLHHRGGRPVSPPVLRKWWRKAAVTAGDQGLIFHDLRRSAVRNMIRAGVSEPVAMSISGHQSAAVFRRHNITSVDDQRRALRRAGVCSGSRPDGWARVVVTRSGFSREASYPASTS